MTVFMSLQRVRHFVILAAWGCSQVGDGSFIHCKNEQLKENWALDESLIQ